MLAGGKYELGRVAAENQEWRTYEARDVPAGRAVLVHQILRPPSQLQGVSLKDLAGRCKPGSSGVIDKFSSEGWDFIVTEVSELFRDLRVALERAAALPAPAPKEPGEDRFTRVGAWRVPGRETAPPKPPEPPGQSATGIFSSPPVERTPVPEAAPGDFTPMFRPAAPEASPPPVRQPETVPEPEPIAPAPPAAIPERPVEPAPAPVAAEPGDFTRMFQAPIQPSQPGAPPVSSQPDGFTSMFQTPAGGQTPPLPAPPVSSKPGEFTSMFQAATPAQGSPSPAPPPVHSEPGSFTRMFQSPASASPAPTPPPQATSKPGEFTQFFQSSLGSAPYKESSPSATPPVAGPAPAPPPGEYTRLFQMPAQPTSPTPAGSGATNVFVTPPVSSPQPAVPIEEGPSEFTRMIQAPPATEAKPAEAPKAVAPAPTAARGMPFALIVLFTALAVIAIGLVLFFVLRH
jgi:hypothetical protein